DGLPEGNLSVLVGRHGAMNRAGRVRGRDNMVAAHIRVGRLTPEGLANRGLVGFRAAPFPPLRSGPTHSISRSPSRGCPCGGGGIPTACMSEPEKRTQRLPIGTFPGHRTEAVSHEPRKRLILRAQICGRGLDVLIVHHDARWLGKAGEMSTPLQP